MQYSLLQLNIFKGKLLNEAIAYIKGNNFDIIHLQEIAGKQNSFTYNDIFAELEQKLQPEYTGVLAKNFTLIEGDQSYDGNATFYKSSLEKIKQEIIWLKKSDRPYDEMKETEQLPRNVLALTMSTHNQSITFINAHLAWSPTAEDTFIKLEQGNILVDYIKTLTVPWILAGDFNVDNNSHIIKTLEEYGRNLAKEYHITNTLNPNIHRAKHLFPKGLAVDFIFTSPEIALLNFQRIDQDLSDHCALTVTFSL